MSETEGSPEPGPTPGYPLKRTPFRAWLVTGPVGRFIGFILDFAKALWAHRKSLKADE